MGLPAKLVRAQLLFFKPFVANSSLAVTRKGQDKLGELMGAIHKDDVIIKDHSFPGFQGAWIVPKDERRKGVILYLHGGGYTCGDLDYAKGFGATLADQCGSRVFCAAYRLAPEYPYPAALEDALESYRYLLKKGYSARQICLCGESAGGGLIFALCLRLKQIGMALPCGIIGISPWTDLTGSGQSYETNRDVDPSMTKELLEFYADCYAGDKTDPLVSPLFGELEGLPPSLLFVGGDEIMLDDTRAMHDRLLASGCQSKLVVAPERWHAYVLYHLNENMSDFDDMNSFLNSVMSREKKLRWMRIDNAGKIYPATVRKNWTNVFRLSATLTEPVDTQILRSALDVTVRRFPSIAVRLRRGLFWFYLEQVESAPEIKEEQSYPLVHMPIGDIGKCAFRVVVYKNRIAVEIFHAITDGTGGQTFLKTLVAEYLTQKYGIAVPAENGVLGRLEEPSEAELEDSFLKYAGKLSASRRENTAYRLSGTPEPDKFVHLTTLMIPAEQIHRKAHEYKVTVTQLVCALMMKAILQIQEERPQGRQRPVKVLVPVNLRQLFPSRTLRNFSLYTTPEADRRLGDYTLEELCTLVHHKMGLDVTAKRMSTMIATNVNSERSPLLKLTPLFLKNLAMRAVFDTVGEIKSCICMSNMGVVKLPDVMRDYVTRMDFIIGVQASSPYNCGIVTYGDTMYLNLVRNTEEPVLERHMWEELKQAGIHVKVESNQR